MSDQNEELAPTQNQNNSEDIVNLSGMYKEYFLDYASYVILERAVPALLDGFKPVQRRILHSMKVMDDGRYHKVANIIGQTMQYHPHGDAAIGDALVNLGQKDLLIDPQGNWGDIRTGDRAAASRYIEARLTKFALEVVFNPQTTDWQMSYDGRKKEPILLPVKFPMALAQGVEGIAVGLSTKIMPHNFQELIKASIKILEGKTTKIYPDFQTGGMIDVTDYNQGKRGGKIKVRAKIEQLDKNTIAITELPYGITTNSLIDSIIKANDKGQIKIKKVVDNTAKDVEVAIDLAPGVSPQVTIDALYAFTNCEISISPNACVIIDNKPLFLSVIDILEQSTFNTKDLLRQELEIRRRELEEKWHLLSLEKIFIEKRIYRDIEECETWEDVLQVIEDGLRKYVRTPEEKAKASDDRLLLMRAITQDDIVKLTEIKIKRISKYNTFKADELIAKTNDELAEVKHHLSHLTEYAIDYFSRLLEKYGKGRERKTVITEFENIQIQKVVANNAKLYANYKEGFVGIGLKKDEYISDCSDIDDVIAFTRKGEFKVVRISDKVFIGKNIMHAAVWKKGDDRTTYNLIYLDGASGRTMAKRFNVTAITRDKPYLLTKGTPGSKVLYFSANRNGESEILNIQLTPGCSAKKKLFEFDFADIAIKGRGSQGNIVTKYPVRKVTFVKKGKSSLGAIKVWMDEVSGRLNKEKRGKYLGAFDTGNKILALYKDGCYEVSNLNMERKYDVNSILDIHKWTPEQAVSAVYYEGDKGWTMVKRFLIETSKVGERYKYISDHRSSKLYYASALGNDEVIFSYMQGGQKQEQTLKLDEFIDVKGWKAAGNKLGEFKIKKIDPTERVKVSEESKNKHDGNNEKLQAGDTIELDF